MEKVKKTKTARNHDVVSLRFEGDELRKIDELRSMLFSSGKEETIPTRSEIMRRALVNYVESLSSSGLKVNGGG